MHKAVIGIDIDGVIVDILTPWLRLYNSDYNDTLVCSDIKAWGMRKFVKPECGSKIFDYLRDPRLYKQAIPIKGAVAGIEFLRKRSRRVVFVTSNVDGQGINKVAWMKQWGFLPRGTRDLVVTDDKTLIRLDILLDDKPKTYEELVFDGRTRPALFLAPYNRNSLAQVWVDGWGEVLDGKLGIWRDPSTR